MQQPSLFLVVTLVLLGQGCYASLFNVVLPANGGLLLSYTSQYNSGYPASYLTNGIISENGWCSERNPSDDQEFIYSFSGDDSVYLDSAIVYAGLADGGSYFTENVEVWTSADFGTTFTLAASGTLPEVTNAYIILDLSGITANQVKLKATSRYTSGYFSFYMLGEFEVYGAQLTSDPTSLPTNQPTHKPTPLPTPRPSRRPTPLPTHRPTLTPTLSPSDLPTTVPTRLPTYLPTLVPTPSPTKPPTLPPSPVPTQPPTPLPSMSPSPVPTLAPSVTHYPTTSTNHPSSLPTLRPSFVPTPDPTFSPTPAPSPKPSPSPTQSPTMSPTLSLHPSSLPTIEPTQLPTPSPTLSCPNGSVFSLDDNSCEVCGIGYFSIITQNNPRPNTCTLCPVGKYSITVGAKSCLTCDVGKLSSTDRSSCKDCAAGEYNNNGTQCSKCERGKYAPTAQDGSCLDCYAGDHTNNGTGATTCSSCDAGKYSGDYAVECIDCSRGSYSTSRASSCVDCLVGTYSNMTGSTSCTSCAAGTYEGSTGSVACSSCPKGQYQPTTGQSLCLSCDGGTYASSKGSLFCSTCATGYDSKDGASTCSLAASGYFLAIDRQTGNATTRACPAHTSCDGSDRAPAPNKGYWVDRSSYGYASVIYRCPRLTCKGSDKTSGCWSYENYTSTDSQCDADALLCTEGAIGPLCGSCDVGYVYSAESKTCTACGGAKEFAYISLIVAGVVIVLVIVLLYGYTHDNVFSRWAKSLDSGSLKILWVTYQIMMSISWNLDIEFPPLFSSMLAGMSFFSLEVLSVECFHESDYFATVYLWSLLPVCFSGLILLSCVLRVLLITENYEKHKTMIINQHIWMFLFLTYLVLPPVAMKQLQGLDCIPFHHDDGSYLRVDTSISCRSSDYYQFKTYDILLLCLYQLIPIFWVWILYRHKDELFVPHGPNEELRLDERDAKESLSHIKFLFKDYKGEKWWFEVAEMYRRIMFIGVLPLCTPDASKRASLGCVFALLSGVYYNEEQPFRVDFTNTIAYVAQFTILATYYTALCINTGSMMDFGLGDVGVGLFLVLVNMVVLGLVVFLTIKRYRKDQVEQSWRRVLTSEEMAIVNEVMSEEDFARAIGNRSSSMMGDNDNGDVEMMDLKATSREDIEKRAYESLNQHLLKPDDVVFTKKVGAGSFGEVFQGTCMGEAVAIKTMINVSESAVREFRAEILLTATLRHPNIVNFVGACWGKELMCLVLEWVAKGSLRDLLKTPGLDLRWNDPLLRLATDIARGMNYLHCRKFIDPKEGVEKTCILHRDLKPDNALVTDYTAAKIADFGTSRSKADDDVTMTAIGTPLYVAPEVSRGEQYDEKVDVYSFGLTLMEMSTDQPILEFIGTRWMVHFDKKKIPKSPMRFIHAMTQDGGWRPVTVDNPIKQAPPAINALIIKCCNHDPSKRPSFQQVFDELWQGDCKKQVDSGSYRRRINQYTSIDSLFENDGVDDTPHKGGVHDKAKAYSIDEEIDLRQGASRVSTEAPLIDDMSGSRPPPSSTPHSFNDASSHAPRGRNNPVKLSELKDSDSPMGTII